MKQSPLPNPADDAALALTALAWILSDGPRAERFLALTGLTPDALRGALDDRATQAAILGFLTGHENDLVSCAAAIDSDPAALAATAARLET
ncbi:MAG: DUF3572 family protein [Sphingopyxis sp.]|nr:DUF3572 family protein [Sphingopyxis sp.]